MRQAEKKENAMSKYIFTDNEKIPAIITVGEYSSPVFIQQLWEDGEYASFIRNNGCGHCCASMALNLCGVNITPYEEFLLCRKMWGSPDEKNGEYNYQSVSGISKVINHFGVACEYFGIAKGKGHDAAMHIEESLKNGKLVIFWSHPSEKLSDNPFSTGEHYVLAFGIEENGNILIANSSNKITDKGVQTTDIGMVEKALYEGADPKDFTWGRDDLVSTGGYVVIG